MLLVPKPNANQWRLINDLRHLNNYCSDFNMTCAQALTPYLDYFASLDMTDDQ
jgi:hypothetical protein